MAHDLAQLAMTLLQADSAVTDLVVDGADGIMETGEILARTIEQAQTTRRNGQNQALVLGIVVMDAGEKATDQQTTQQRVGVWIYDRERGYANIRLARKAVYGALEGKCAALESPLTGRTTAIVLTFDSRTGHLIERSMEVDLEYMIFTAVVKKDLG